MTYSSDSSNRLKNASNRQSAYKRKRNIDWGMWGAVVFIAAIVIVGVGACQAYFGSTRDVTVKVNKTGQTCSQGKCTNLVYTDHGTYKNSDSLLAGKFNSSDVTGALCPGGVYELKVRGYRVGYLSMWPNILKVEKIVTPPPANLGCG